MCRHKYLCIRACNYVGMYAYMCMYIDTYIHINIYIYICTYKYIDIEREKERKRAKLKMLFTLVPVLFFSTVWFVPVVSLSVYIAYSRPGRIERPREARPEDSICYEVFDFHLGFLS